MPEPQTGQQKTIDILQALSQFLPKMGGIFGRAGGGMAPGGGATPGRVGSMMPLFQPGTPGAPQNLSGGGGGMPGGTLPTMAATMGAPSQNQPQDSGPVPIGTYATGVEFGDKQGRNAAVVTNALQGVTSLISKYKQNQESKTRAKAEGYFNQIVAAQQAGDQQALALLLEDPKVIKTLEKGLNYFMPKVPGEPPPPEAMGVHGAIQKLGKMNQPGGVSFPVQSKGASAQRAISDLTSTEALKRLQADPSLAGTLGLGTSLSGSETRTAERGQAGLELSPAQRTLMTHEDNRIYDANLQTMKLFQEKNKAELAQLAAQIQGQKDVATIHAGPLYERAKIARDISEAQIKMKKELSNGNVRKANSILMTTLTSQINNLRTNATKAKKEGQDDQAAQWTQTADELQKQYDDAKKTADLDVDSIVERILGSSSDEE